MPYGCPRDAKWTPKAPKEAKGHIFKKHSSAAPAARRHVCIRRWAAAKGNIYVPIYKYICIYIHVCICHTHRYMNISVFIYAYI